MGLLFILCILGCGDTSEPTRQALRGSVTVDGAQLEDGAISLRPVAGHSAPAAVTTIKNGTYRFTKKNGPMPGPYSVKINIDPESDQGRALLRGGTTASGAPEASGPKGGSLAPVPRSQRAQSQPKLHWEVEYTVSEDGSGEKDFALSN
ncbi:MAG: hypothetical protein WD070_01605 [Pirellulaceae bacterium]